MKYKFIKVLIVLAFCFVPFVVRAAEITGVSVSGLDSVKVGEEFTLTVGVNYSGVSKGTFDTLGVAVVGFDIDFDSDVFTLTDYSSSDWDTVVGQEDGSYYLLSSLSGDSSNNKCADDVLYCDNYQINLKFFVKNTDKTFSSIKIGEVAVGLFPVDSEYDEEDLVLLSINAAKEKGITINNTNNNVAVEPPAVEVTPGAKDIITATKKETIDEIKEETKEETEEVKNTESNDNFLKSLKVKGQKLDFTKEKTTYEIVLDKNVNSINVEALAENKNAKVKIIGADDLEKNDNKVVIEVTDEAGSVRNYTIKIIKDTSKKEEKKSFNIIKILKNYSKLIFITLGIIVIIIILIILIKYIKNRRLEKALDNFEKM